MKRFFGWAFLFLIYLKLVTLHVDSLVLKRIKFNLQKDQVGVTFMSEDNMKALLLHYRNKDTLVVLEALNGLELENSKLFFQIQKFDQIILNDGVILEESYQKKGKILADTPILVDDIKIFHDKNNVILNYDTKNLCIYEDTQIDFSRCDFVYFLNSNMKEEIPSTVSIAIYDPSISEETMLKNYASWVDTIKLSDDYFATIIFNKKDYQSFKIPLQTD